MASTSLGDKIMPIGIAFGVVDTVAVILRLFARWKNEAGYAADDLLISLCLLPLYGMVAIGSVGAQESGLGHSKAVIPQWQLPFLLKLLMFGNAVYTLTTTVVKLSLLTMYRRLFITAVFRKQVRVVGAACLLWFFVFLFLDIFQCHPFDDAFDPTKLASTHCVNLGAYYFARAASNLVLDIAMLYLPIAMVWKLSLNASQKVGLSAIFLIGGLVCLGGAMQIVAISVQKKGDLTATVALSFLWAQVEPATAILCACAVTYRPLFRNCHLPRLHRRNSNSSLSHTRYEGELEPQFHWPRAQNWHKRHERRLPHVEAPNFNSMLTRDESGMLRVGLYQANWTETHIHTEPSKSFELSEERAAVPADSCEGWPLRAESLGTRIERPPSPYDESSGACEIFEDCPRPLPKADRSRSWELRHF